MRDDLDAFMADYGARPWVWGEVDCCMVLAAWLARCGYAEAASPFVGCYTSEEECNRIIEAAGGVLALVTARMVAIGLEAVQEPVRGAIGVIGSPRNRLRQWGAIHDGDRWMVRMREGFAEMTSHELGIWRCRKS